jgi:hypothetical protein
MDKKQNTLIALILSVIGVPFIVTLVRFFKKGPDEPVTMGDLLAIFGVQVLVAVAIMLYVLFFFHPIARLG